MKVKLGATASCSSHSNNEASYSATSSSITPSNQHPGSQYASPALLAFAESQSSQPTLGLSDEHSLSPSFPTQIQTRSAAKQQKQNSTTTAAGATSTVTTTNNITTLSSFKRHHHHHPHQHHSTQHTLGKIVKPIPVRPVSTSSSSSSTHSSSFGAAVAHLLKSSNEQEHHNHHHHHHHNHNHHHNHHNNHHQLTPLSEQASGSFSLIAKYFASFPATRLKAQSPGPTSVESNNGAVVAQPLQATTPFLPFTKKATFAPVSGHHHNHHQPTPVATHADANHQVKTRWHFSFVCLF